MAADKAEAETAHGGGGKGGGGKDGRRFRCDHAKCPPPKALWERLHAFPDSGSRRGNKEVSGVFRTPLTGATPQPEGAGANTTQK